MRDESFYWFRLHPMRGWQIWSGGAADDLTWCDFAGFAEPGTLIHDRILAWSDTWCEPEAED